MVKLSNKEDKRALLNTYNRAPLSFVKGKGVWLTDKEGKKYLDFAAGIAVNSLGHGHPKLVKALIEQGKKLWHTSNIYEIPNQEKLASLLTEVSFAEKIFFTNSGAESLECAIKIARRYFFHSGEREKNKIITLKGSFHGRTISTIAAAGSKKLLEGFGPKAPGFESINLNDLQSLEEKISRSTCGILIEPILGEGGIIPLPFEILKMLRAICSKNNILLIFDEVQTGVGRTGYFFAHEKFKIKPDILAAAKGIGGGFPIGACLTTNKIAECMTPGTHGSTYGGNPLACAVASAVVKEIIQPEFLNDVKRKGIIFKSRLNELVNAFPRHLKEVRGSGLMLGLKCVTKNTMLVDLCRREKLLLVAGGDNTVRVLPPLTVKDREIDQALNKLSVALKNMEKEI
jgi:acetylornithine/N-succinyldiaminopimelate aminotransferase